MKTLLLTCFTSLFLVVASKIDSARLKCLVCETSLGEMHKEVLNLDPSKLVDVGGHRLNAQGNYEHKSVSQRKSAIKLSEICEKVCEKMDDFVRATKKTSGELILMQLMLDGAMNPMMSDADIVQDDDLNQSLKYNCQDLMGEYEDSIIEAFQAEEDVVQRICREEAGLCPSNIPNEEL